MEPFHADWFGQYKYDSFCMQSISIRFGMKKTLLAQHYFLYTLHVIKGYRV